MTLVVRLSVNDGPPVAMVSAVRTSGGTEPDDVNGYHYVVAHRGAQSVNRHASPWRTVSGNLEHRYGDGALALLRDILGKVDLAELTEGRR